MHKTLTKDSMSMYSSIKNNNINLLSQENPSIPCIHLGIIGCGRIGSFILKNLISLKENFEEYKIKIYVSTRRPHDIMNTMMDRMTDQIEIFLDNERIFKICQIIFICVQSHQFDNLQLEICEIFKNRIENIKKKKEKIFPTVISCMAGVSVGKLKIILGSDVNIHSTYIDPKKLEKSREEFFIDNCSIINGTNIIYLPYK